MRFLKFALLLCFVLGGGFARAEEPKWVKATSEHFELYTDTSDSKGQRLLIDLEQRVEACGDAFGKVPPFQFPIHVFLFKNSEDFLASIPDRQPVDGAVPPEKNAYVVNGPDRLYILAKDKSPQDIANDAAHSLGHALFEHTVMWRPFWLSEGIAEYVRKLGRDADNKEIKEKDAFSVDDLLTIVPSADYQDSEPGGAFRTQSYRLLRVLLQEQPQALREYIQALSREDGKDAKLNVDVEKIATTFQDYVESPIKLPPVVPIVKSEPVDPATVAVRRGEMLVATGKNYEASRYLNGSSPQARAARAIAARFSRPATEAVTVLARAAEELPDNGLVQYHFGAIETQNKVQVKAQAEALQRAVKLLPVFGRAYAQLARVDVLNGEASQALPLLDRAVELEPEYADSFFEIRADALVSLGRLDEAYKSIKVGEALPHGDRKAVEAYTVKVMNITKKIENARREVDSQKLERIRRDVEAEVNEREPVQPPPPPVKVPEGQINYEITAAIGLDVVNAVYPEYPEALRQMGKMGKVTLRVQVAPDGSVKNAVATNSQVPELNAATIDAAKKWVFKLGHPRTTPVNISLTFIYTLQ
jgi:TonB family protein